MNIERNIQLDI